MRVTVVGMGYVGMATGVMLSREHDVTFVDVDAERVSMFLSGHSPVVDGALEAFIASGHVRMHATLDGAAVYGDTDIVFVAVPTDYEPVRGHFDTSAVETVVEDVFSVNERAVVVIKSTVPVGFTDGLAERHPGARILFSPEFLREGHALEDVERPSRVIVGISENSAFRDELGRHAEEVSRILSGVEEQAPRMVMSAAEAESVKLFSNTYLALRVAFFNELDTFASLHGLDSRALVEGVGLDPRIGTHYNNPSFGYGGYCLPKDTRQLLANFGTTPQDLIAAVVSSNATRKAHVVAELLARVDARRVVGTRPVVGIHRLAMKNGSEDSRDAAVFDVIRGLLEAGVDVLVHEPSCAGRTCLDCEVTGDLASFKERSTVIAANRWSPELDDVAEKVYCRDLFGRD